MSYQDKTVTCQDCGASFTFSEDDQRYHAEKGYTNEPKRCTRPLQALTIGAYVRGLASASSGELPASSTHRPRHRPLPHGRNGPTGELVWPVVRSLRGSRSPLG